MKHTTTKILTKPKAIVTIPPYAPFIHEVLQHEAVSGIRLNTVMPVTEPLEDVVDRLNSEALRYGKELWVDLKCRQLRVKTYGVPPFTEIELTHNINVRTPITAYFSDGKESATVLRVDKNRLIMQEGPGRVVGPGESVNIPDYSLRIEGFFTNTDKAYIEAGKQIGFHNYMLSFVEDKNDKSELLKLDPKAIIVEKIESLRGMDYVVNDWDGSTNLMTARGDLYLELKMPHKIVQAQETVIKKNPAAIVASRIFSSLAYNLEPSCEDIGDVENLLRTGYKTLMFGDDICMKRESIISGLNLFETMSRRYER